MTAKRFNFTKPAIDALPLPEKGKRAYHYDAKTRGLCIGVTSTGVKTFFLYRKIGGRPERILIGRYPDLTIEQASGKASKLNGEIADGQNPQANKRAMRAEATFADLFAEYIDRHSKLNKKTWAEDEERYRRNIEKSLAKKKLSTISRSDISNIHVSLSKAGRRITANRVLALISSVYGWAISAGLCESNPAKGIRRNPEKSRDRFIQADELPRFFRALADEPNETMRDYFLLSLLTGARRANVLAMQWKDINLERGEWRIEETKNGTPQTVHLSPEALEVLRNRMRQARAGYVFPSSGRSGHLVEPKKGWRRVLDRAEIDNLRIHDLRRTLGSWQAKTGASLAIIGKSLNHKNQNTTAIYARLDLDPVRDAVNTATSAMMAAAGLKSSGKVVKLKRKQI